MKSNIFYFDPFIHVSQLSFVILNLGMILALEHFQLYFSLYPIVLKTKIVNRKSNTAAKITDKQLIRHAVKALRLSYSPYSNFAVGAAILKSNGKIYLGANIENASYPLCLCAERVAISHAHSVAPKSKIAAIAVVCKSSTHAIESPVSPCGACRQVISEFENLQDSPIKIILGNISGENILKFESINELLPYSFNSKFLIG